MEPSRQLDLTGLSSRQSLPPISEVIQSIKLSNERSSSLSSNSEHSTHAYHTIEEDSQPQIAHPISTSSITPRRRSDISDLCYRSFDGTDTHTSRSTPAAPAYGFGRVPPPDRAHFSTFSVSLEHGTPSRYPASNCFRAPLRTEGIDYDAQARQKALIDWYSEHWSFEESLNEIMSLSRTISNFAEANNKITSRQRTARIIPDRLPTEREVTEMLGNLEHVKRLLEQVKDVQSAIRPKGAQPGTKLLRRHQEHVMDLSDGVMKPQYAITDVMEYRDHGVPQNQCPRCGRTYVPVWRDGLGKYETTCSACGPFLR